MLKYVFVYLVLNFWQNEIKTKENQMIKKLAIMAIGAACFLHMAAYGHAQEEMEAMFILGVVQEVSAASITITNSTTMEQEEIALVINSDTAFDNVGSADEISAGDEVFVDYVLKGDENIALNIFREDPDEESYGEDSLDDLTILEESSDGTAEDQQDF